MGNHAFYQTLELRGQNHTILKITRKTPQPIVRRCLACRTTPFPEGKADRHVPERSNRSSLRITMETLSLTEPHGGTSPGH
jgi:hypothetical protein